QLSRPVPSAAAPSGRSHRPHHQAAPPATRAGCTTEPRQPAAPTAKARLHHRAAPAGRPDGQGPAAPTSRPPPPPPPPTPSRASRRHEPAAPTGRALRPRAVCTNETPAGRTDRPHQRAADPNTLSPPLQVPLQLHASLSPVKTAHFAIPQPLGGAACDSIR